MIVNKQYRIPKELHDKFKEVTKQTGTTMNNALCHLIADYVYRMEQLGLPEVKEPTIFHAEPAEEEEEVKPKKLMRKLAKKKQGGEKNARSKEVKTEAEKDSKE